MRKLLSPTSESPRQTELSETDDDDYDEDDDDDAQPGRPPGSGKLIVMSSHPSSTRR